MNILHLDSSITGPASVTRQLSAEVVAKLQAAHSGAEVVYRDLAQGVPAIDHAWFGAVRMTPADPTPAQKDLIAVSDAYLAEVQNADVIVLGLPVYNFTIPAQVKNWIDQIARAGVSFRYTENGPVGLLKGKRVIVTYAAAGTPLGSDLDFASGYLRFVLGFLGMTDVTFIAADGLAMDREAGLARAHAGIEALAV